MLKILFSLFFSTGVMATMVAHNSVIGCNQNSQTHTFDVFSNIELNKKYYDQLKDNFERSKFVKKSVQLQLKYFVGIFTEFHTPEIDKISFSAYQLDPIISNQGVASVTYPVLDKFWPESRGDSSDPYIQFLQGQGVGQTEVIRFSYKTRINFFMCNKKKLTPDSIVNVLNTITVPKDPYIGFWINTKEEREELKRSNKTISKPYCLSFHYLNFGRPEEAWFFWTPTQHYKSKGCQTENHPLITKFRFNYVPTKIDTQMSWEDARSELNGSIFFGFVNVDSEIFFTPSPASITKLITHTLNLCKNITVPLCLTEWNNKIKELSNKPLEIGSQHLINFLKYFPIENSINEIKTSEIGSNYFILSLKAKNKISKKIIHAKIYYGPTSLYDPLLAPKKYWEKMRQSLLEDDFLFYTGHAGIGANLKWETIDQQTNAGAKIIPRQKPLYLGIFNCEGLSYYGFDYDKLFATKNNLYFLSTSGVEVNFSFTYAFLSYLSKKNHFDSRELKNEIDPYVWSRDFLGFQILRY